MALPTWRRGNHVLIETAMVLKRDDPVPKVDENVVRVIEE
jgi:hypothetical protein